MKKREGNQETWRTDGEITTESKKSPEKEKESHDGEAKSEEPRVENFPYLTKDLSPHFQPSMDRVMYCL